MKPLKHPLQTKRDQNLDEAALRARTRCRRAQARYRQTEKGKATAARYNGSATHRAAAKRYRSTEKGQKVVTGHNARRIFIGANYRGLAQSIEQATEIQTHIQKRLHEFISRRAACLDAAPTLSPTDSSEARNGR